MSDILIVDDERDIRDLIADILKDEGFETRTAANSDEAVASSERARALADDPGHLAQGQPDGRDRHPQAGQAQQPGRAGHHHLGSRQYRDRGRRHQAGRLRLHREALQHRPADGGHQPRDGNQPPAPRELEPAPRRRAGGRNARPVGGAAAAAGRAGQGRQVQRPGDADRRARHRQGAGGPLHPRPFAARAGALHHRPLRHHRARADGGGAVRPRKRRARDRAGPA